MPKFTLTELKKKREKLARHCMQLQDALYEDCYNEELRLDYVDAEDEYQYLNKLIERMELTSATYTITVAQCTYGNIQVEANGREEAKKKALELAKANPNCVNWFEDKSYRVAEVYRHEGGN